MKAEMPCTVLPQKLSITLGKIVRLKSYRGQPKKDPKSFIIAGANTAFSFIIFGYSCFDLLELPEASRSG
jgi:hypothetical protein